MDFRRSTTIIIWSFVLIILTCNFNVDAAKASRRGGSSSKNKSPNYDHVALSYGGHGHRTGSSNQHQPVQQHQVHQTHTQQAHAPSAPALPSSSGNNNNNNKPIGWNVPHTDAVNQPKTVSQTHSALPYPQNPPPYQQNAGFNSHPPAGPPPPYSANSNPGFNSHPPAGPPPPYSQNPNPSFTSSSHVQQPPAYQPNQPAASYPVHNAPNAAYPQQNYNMNPAGIHPSGGQAPIINNYYGHPGVQTVGGSSGGGSGPSLLGTALAAGAGSIAGNALYGALKPDSEHKTVVIHENAPVAQQPIPQAPVAQAAPIPASPPSPIAAGEPMTSTVSVPLASSEQPTVAQAPVMSSVNPPYSPSGVPLAPLPESTVVPSPSSIYPSPSSSIYPSLPPSSFPSSAMPESTPPVTNPIPSTNVPTINTSSARMENSTSVAAAATTTTTSSSVPLAPFPSDTSAQAQKGSATSFVIFNISVYTIISILIAGLF